MNFFFSSRRRHTFFFQAEDGIRDRSPSRGLGDVYKRQPEWRLGGLDSYERLAITGKAAYDYVDELDLYLKTGIKTPRRSVWGLSLIHI